MRIASTLTFAIALTVGVNLSQQIRPFVEWVRLSERVNPSLSLEEASIMIGHHVRCAYRTDTFSGV